MVEVLPGDPARVILGQFATPESVAALNQELELDRPAPVRYLDWLKGVLTGDFGESLNYRRPISDVIGDRIINSLILAAVAALIAVPLGVGLGLVTGSRRGSAMDRIVTWTSVGLMSLPEFLIGIGLIWLLSNQLDLLPPASLLDSGELAYSDPTVLILPALTACLVMLGYVMRITRSSVAEVRQRRFVTTADLKGVEPRRVTTHHVARNALAPTVTVVAAYGGWLIGGMVIIEALFAYPGLGHIVYQAVTTRDLPLVEASVLVVAASMLMLNLLADVMYALLDPRVAYS